MWLDRLQSRKHSADKYGRHKLWVFDVCSQSSMYSCRSRRNSEARSLDDQFNFRVVAMSHLHHFSLTSSTDETIQLYLVFIVKTPLVEVKQIQIV